MFKKLIRIVAGVVALAVLALGAFLFFDAQQRSKLPAGIVSGNGRIESVQVDVSAKYPGRVVRIFAHEGDLVRTSQVLAQIDTAELDAELAGGKAKIAEAVGNEVRIKADILTKEATLRYQDQEFARNRELFNRRVISREEMEQSMTKRDIARSDLEAEKAKLKVNERTIEAATADVQNTQAKIVDSTLVSPVNGRVLYRLAEEREVLGAGGKVLTLVNLDDVYMEIFLPSDEAARIDLGAEARIVLDAVPEYAAKANVTFISPEAQFTPKQVETRTERDKLMFRVKLKVPHDLLLPYIERIKTGVRGVGYVKLDPATPWPEKLERRFPPPRKSVAPKPPDEPKPAEAKSADPAPAPEATPKAVEAPAKDAAPAPAAKPSN
ncbi:HlyD family secretion protein [Paludisphaera mucosa]|uniref:HlyD family efflux transporter periplasmic adaptor subunit n=1 Tax=Paludisphaera mucosa TaxID=3030827 RepID=A0ABT6F5E3_9BACT|nr:HlyD family efflux transporter periplasmic adaptor subunit [Paludisphaera mucosa]MDG3002796.1 HlyD family efflux transporter periplasmic adaptor subunit [Paludisphaera mucosa]